MHTHLEELLLGELESGSDLTHAHSSHLVSDLDSLVDALSSDESSTETAGKGVSCTVGVHNLVVVELVDFVDLGLAFAFDDDGAIGSLSDDNGSRALGIGLVKGSQLLCDLGDILGLRAC